MRKPLTVYIGYDPREEVAYDVCRASLERHASIPLHIIKLELKTLAQIGLCTRRFRKDGGQMIDEIDGRPFSTEFAFSRFLAPALSLYDGWAVFCDCDFLFTRDIAELLQLLDEQYAVMAVKHEHIPSETVKMDGQSQCAYPRKNWSSFVAWNCDHPDNRFLNIRTVNTEKGKWLHGFGWLSDEKIGALPQTWNWLSGVSEPLPNFEVPACVHFTLGHPLMPGYEEHPYAELWFSELDRLQAGRAPNQPLRAIA